ncbi:hypothetical protein FSARC_4137 [Fusarium sarcochroum]|uniref:BTB domain-containing protein n=1 Tax=Fusarium sarcochroum TaxID=1208366 RepID=A0A8H4U296_9HYPO|nr:hypothetical protein FSARC_4137 [Fusarium sarcochroum]
MALPSRSFLLPLIESGKYSDFTLICKGHEFKLHQVIVCPQSPVLTAALSGGFQEAISKVITVNGFDLPAVQHMISFLYTGEYQIVFKSEQKSTSDDGQNREEADAVSHSSPAPSEPTEDETVEILLSHLRVNAIADYYNIQNLSQLANSKIQAILEETQDADVFPKVLQEVSTSNRDADLHSIIASATAKCIEQLTELQTFRDVELEHSLSMEILRACGTRIHKLQHELKTTQQEAAAYQASEASEKLTKKLFIEQTNDSIDFLGRTFECRHCSKDFGCYFEKRGLREDASLWRHIDQGLDRSL